MPQVIFLPHERFCPDGLVVEAEPGISILELAHEHHIEMESACGGVCACTTCHCIVREGFDSLNEADELEEINQRIRVSGGSPAIARDLKPASVKRVLLGITREGLRKKLLRLEWEQ